MSTVNEDQSNLESMIEKDDLIQKWSDTPLSC